MRGITLEQNWGPMCWTPVEADGWLTHCTTYVDDRTVLEVFRWPPLEPMHAAGDDDDEMRAWAATAREAFSMWAKENPY